MTKLTRVTLDAPFFPGFNYSILDDSDSLVENDVEYIVSQSESAFAAGEVTRALTKTEARESLWNHYIGTGFRESQIAEIYAEEFADKFRELTGINLQVNFESIWRPREYNFESDKARISCSLNGLMRVFRKYGASETFRAVIARRHTSRSGFFSYMSADFSDWRDPEAYDERHWTTLLIAAMESEGYDDDDESSLAMITFYRASESCIDGAEYKDDVSLCDGWIKGLNHLEDNDSPPDELSAATVEAREKAELEACYYDKRQIPLF